MNSRKQMLFQNKKKKEYFEGWYYKLLNAKEDVVFSIIFGISKSIEDPHAFIQVINNYNNKTYYFKYSLTTFTVQNAPFMITIEKNMFTEEKIVLDIEDVVNIKGIVKLGEWTEIDQSVYTPNIMGPFAYIPWMECNHAVISLRHKVNGNITIDGNFLNFDDGVGYIEKDYGTSFPSRYIWIQSNSVKTKNSLFFSYANVPFKLFRFNGLICILEINGEQHRFATYNGSKIRLLELNEEISIEIQKGSKILKINLSNHLSHPLVAPIKGNMNQVIMESLDGIVEVSLYNHEILEWKGTLNNVASEVFGEF